jgi:hypothetical protein
MTANAFHGVRQQFSRAFIDALAVHVWNLASDPSDQPTPDDSQEFSLLEDILTAIAN